jgi:hypothetical protein
VLQTDEERVSGGSGSVNHKKHPMITEEEEEEEAKDEDKASEVEENGGQDLFEDVDELSKVY